MNFIKKSLDYSFEKSQTIESFHEPPKLGREDYFSTLKQTNPDFEEIIRTKAIVVKTKIPKIEELTM